MADTARGAVSMTPVVTILADADSDSVDVIHHDIKKILGGKLEYVKADADDKWIYNASRDIAAASADLIPAGTSFTEGGTNVAADDVRFLFLKHSGTTDGSTPTSSTVYITLTAGDATSVANSMEIGKDEAFIVKLRASGGTDCQSLHVGTSSGVVRCTLVAIVDDGG